MSANYIKINGQSFDAKVAISDYEENFNVLDGENAGRVKNGGMVRDVIGTYIGHKITFFSAGNAEGFDALWDYLVQHSVDDFVTLEAADGQSTIIYEAYYTSGKRKIRTVQDGVNYWNGIEVNFVPVNPQVTP